MAAFSIFQLVSILCVALFFVGLMNVYFSDRVNNCQMTYMFEYPQFVRIRVEGNDLYPQYGLHSYSEGRLTERARKMRFDGIPVLFLPGSSGSHMQVRSLASVALRKALSYEYEVHFDFFTVSYNEELSGLFGGVLEKQLEFATMCQKSILNLYRANSYMQRVPTSVIIIGHSMGGLIAKALLTHPSTQNMTNIVITLSAPVQAPVVNFDEKINDFYMTVKEGQKDPLLRDKVLISFGGGARDVMVPSAFSGSEDGDFNGLTTSVPGVWTSTDHVSIVWCKQFVIVVNKFLFSLINFRTNELINDKAAIVANAKRFFQANRSVGFDPDVPRQMVALQPDAFWFEDSRRIYQLQKPEITRTTYVMLRLVSFSQNRFAAIEAINVDDRDWLFGCNAAYVNGHMRYCKNGESLSDLSRWTASADLNKRKMATIPLHDLLDMKPDWTHVVLKISPTRKPITLNIDINDKASRTINVELPYFLTFYKKTLVEETEMDAVYYELKLLEMNRMFHSYLLHIEPTERCKSLNYHVTAEMHIPWAPNHEYTHHFTHQSRTPMRLLLTKGNLNRSEETDASVTLLLDPQCTYTISISHSFYGALGQIVRYYAPHLLPYVAAILILIVREHLVNMKDTGYCGCMLAAMASENLKPYYVLVMAKLGWIVLRFVPTFNYVLEMSFLTDGVFLLDQGGPLLPVFLYVTALGIVMIVSAFTLAIMLFSSQLVHRLLWRFVWSGGAIFGETLSSMLARAPVLCSVALLLAAHTTSSPVAIACSAAVYAILVSRMYEEYLEELGYKLVAKFIWRFLSRFKFNKQDLKREQSQQEADERKVNESLALKDGDKPALTESESSSESDKALALPEKPNDEIEDKSAETNDETPKELVKVDDAPVNESEVTAVRATDDVNDSTVQDGEVEEVTVDTELSNINFHTTVFFLYVIVAIVNAPGLVTWARNFKYSVVLRPDPSYGSGVVMSACAGFLWQMDGLRPNLKYYEHLSSALFGLAVITMVMGPLALYYINYTITITILLITIQQLFDKEVEKTQVEDKSQEGDVKMIGDGDGAERPRAGSDVAKDPDAIYSRFKDVKEKHEFANLDLNVTESTC